MRKVFSLQNSWILFPLALLFMDTLLSGVSPSRIDYALVFVIGLLFTVLDNLLVEYLANRVMILSLHQALLARNILDKEDLFLAQNNLVGDTPSTEIKKMRKKLGRYNIYIEDYVDDEDVRRKRQNIKSNDYSIFKSFRGLTDKLKEEIVPKLNRAEE
ncbi:MAG: hypothetical protein WDZ80_06305 [Candidatus Paceibacterota bacterium]